MEKNKLKLDWLNVRSSEPQGCVLLRDKCSLIGDNSFIHSVSYSKWTMIGSFFNFFLTILFLLVIQRSNLVLDTLMFQIKIISMINVKKAFVSKALLFFLICD